MSALIVDARWLGVILRGDKAKEMRTRGCRIRGLVGLIRKRSGTVVGVAELVDTVRIIRTGPYPCEFSRDDNA